MKRALYRLNLLMLTLGLAIAGRCAGRESQCGGHDSKIKPARWFPGLQVTVINERTNSSISVPTDDSGNYAAFNLVPGSYTISAQLAGFSRQVFKGFVLQVGQVARLDMVLEVGAVAQEIEVTAVVPLLQTEDASVGQVISPEPIAALPLNGRNFAQLAILAPGVSGLDYAQPGTINSGRRPDELRRAELHFRPTVSAAT